MEKSIKYKQYFALFTTHGAELLSLQKNNENILWNRDSIFWGDSALVLFPFIGRNYEDTYTYKNKSYNQPIHGFACRSEFSVKQQSQNSITFQLVDSNETFQNYPFHFNFEITYTLNDTGLEVQFFVTNTSKESMYYTLGYHPGFMLHKALENYRILFPNASKPQEMCIVPKCMLTGEIKDFNLKNNTLTLSKDLFTNSARILTGVGNKAILETTDSIKIVELEFENFENIVLWQTLNSDANFICIEGWRGLPGKYEEIEDIENVTCKSCLKPNETCKFTATLHF